MSFKDQQGGQRLEQRLKGEEEGGWGKTWCKDFDLEKLGKQLEELFDLTSV